MHGEHKVKLINAQQAKPIYHYQNIKEKNKLPLMMATMGPTHM
jgi:hypothetical protein